jgi:hypothetical protein
MNDEGKFLHDLSTPLGTLLLLTESMVSEAKNQANPDFKQVTKLESIMVHLNRMQTLMHERKEYLVHRENH